MKKSIILVASLMGVIAMAQEKVNQQVLQKQSADLSEKFKQDKIQYENTEFSKHFPPNLETSAFQGYDNNAPIIFSIDSRNQVRSMNVDALSNGDLPGISASGEGMTAYIWDGGKARLTHIEFEDRITQIEETGSNSDHATGVGGVIISAGKTANAVGLAPKANLKVLNFSYGNTISEITLHSAMPENKDYMISNHSYGQLAGWNYNNQNKNWYWWGFPSMSATETAYFGHYAETDQLYDRAAFNSPQHSIFKSSGNNNGEGPSGVVDHYAFNDAGGWQLFTGVARPNDCEETGGYDCLAMHGGTAKNLIVVGSTRPIPGAGYYNQPNDVKISSFSSWGPTDDGRIKPDVVAVGQTVFAPSNTSDEAYSYWQGTSFSSPAAAGVGVLLQQIKKETDGGYLRSDMMKALLINTANETGDHIGPDYTFGFGLIDALKATQTMLNINNDSFTTNYTLHQDETYNMKFVAKGNEPIKATIAWLDPEATPVPFALNDRTPMLVNDLDMRITQGGTTHFPWKLDVENPAAAATQGDNIIDNVEQIFIENPVAGETYNLTVSHKGNLTNSKQVFALVINGVTDVLGTKDVDLTDKINIFPNPVVDQLNIQLDPSLKNAQVRIFDTMGGVVYNNNAFNNTEQINMSSFPSGIYMVYIKSDQGTTTKKIIKK